MYVRSRNAMEVTVFAVVGLASARQALGIRALPGSLAQADFPWGQITASSLTFGCIVALIGMFWRNRDDGVLIEQVGCMMVAIATFGYATAVMLLSGIDNGIYAVSMSLGIGLACIIRYFQIQAYIQRRRNAALRGSAESPFNVRARDTNLGQDSG